MAARRLLIVMLVLLGISSVIAVITPNPRKEATEREEQTGGVSGATGTTGSTGSTGSTGDTGSDSGSPADRDAAPGRQVASPAPAGALVAGVRLGGEAEEITGRPGQRLILTVTTRKPAEISVPGLGLTTFTDRYAPAYLDLLLPSAPGRYPVLAATPGNDPGSEPVARITVEG